MHSTSVLINVRHKYQGLPYYFFFFPNKNHTYLKFSIYMKIQGGFSYFQTKKDSPAEFERNRFLDAPNRFYRDFCLKDKVSFSLKEA